MPEMTFRVRWPDGRAEACYSPSLVLREHLAAGATYAVPDFLDRVRAALTEASRRVEAKYGVPCGRALGQLARIEAAAAPFLADPDAAVTVDAFTEPPGGA